MTFQFHKGAIRTPISSDFFADLQSFNSIKVQLEPDDRFTTCALYPRFNSIKVQLEPFNFHYVNPSLTSFQFHKGAIRTLAAVRIPCEIYGFNSIKVQLERYEAFFVPNRICVSIP